MANANSALKATITSTDANNNTPVIRDVGSIVYAGKTGQFLLSQETGNAGVDLALSLPVTPVFCIYIKNLHATGTLTVKATPQGGAEATIIVLAPGAAFLVFSPANTALTGYTSIKVNSSVANSPFDCYIGG